MKKDKTKQTSLFKSKKQEFSDLDKSVIIAIGLIIPLNKVESVFYYQDYDYYRILIKNNTSFKLKRKEDDWYLKSPAIENKEAIFLTEDTILQFQRIIGAIYHQQLIQAKPFQNQTCSKCNGTKYLPQFAHIANGICFQCRKK